jgi:predicted site-specific integrase-resolvase
VDNHLDENRLAKRWSMSPRTLQRWRQDGKGPPFLKLGGRVIYRVSDIETWERGHLHDSSLNRDSSQACKQSDASE